MRVVCPSCQAAYGVPDQRLGPQQAHRRVRCFKCGHEFRPDGTPFASFPTRAPATAPATVPATAAAPASMAPAPPAPQPPAGMAGNTNSGDTSADISAGISTNVSTAAGGLPGGGAPVSPAVPQSHLSLNESRLALAGDRGLPPGSRAMPEEEGDSALTAWILSLILIAALAWAVWAYRAPIMHAWPPSIRFYHAIRLR